MVKYKVECKLDSELNIDDEIENLVWNEGGDAIFWWLEEIFEIAAGGDDIRGDEVESIFGENDENNGWKEGEINGDDDDNYYIEWYG